MISSHPKATIWQQTIFLLVVLLVGIASRLPLLLSPNLILDGDECIVGLMAKHITEGKPVTLYFYGQKYGFAYLEAVAGALSFKLFGYGTIQLKSAMLALWLGALAFFYLTAVRLTNPVRGFGLALLLALFPAWAVWSLKARGGYLTSFLLSSILVYIFSSRKKDLTPLAWFGTGAFLALIFYSQVFWLAGLLPLISYHYFRYAKKLNILFLVAGGVLVIAGFYFFGTSTSNFWHPVVLGKNEDHLEALLKLGRRFFVYLTGYYYLMFTYKADLATRIIVITWISIFILLLAFQIYRFWLFYNSLLVSRLSNITLKNLGQGQVIPALLQKFNAVDPPQKAGILSALVYNGFREKAFFYKLINSSNKNLRQKAAWLLFTLTDPQTFVFFIATSFILGYTLLLNNGAYGPRYLLPLGCFMLLWIGREINQLLDLKLIPKNAIIIITAILIIAGCFSMWGFRKYTLLQYMTSIKKHPAGSEEERLNDVFNYLQKHNISTTYTSEGLLLQWFIHFYSKEKIACRGFNPTDRYPAYAAEVDSAYKKGKPVALVGYYFQNRHFDDFLDQPEKIKRVGYWYYVYLNPTNTELKKLGFYKELGQRATPEFVAERLRLTKYLFPAATSL